MPISIVDVDGNRIIIPTNNRELKKAIKLMLKSEIGKKLYREIKRSKTEIVYITVDKLDENKAGATYSIVSDGHTLLLKGSSLSLDDVDVDRELIKNGTIKVFHIIINENLIVENGFSKLYRIAFALFHELDMHVKGHIEGDQEDSETHVSKEHEEGGMKSLVDDQGEYDGFIVRQFSRTSKFMHQIQSYLERKGRLNQQEVSDLKKVRSDIENYVVDREVFNELPNPATREEVEREKAKENEK